jgi:hypothetical protein
MKGETVGLQSKEDGCTQELNGRILCGESVFPRKFLWQALYAETDPIPNTNIWRKM